MRSVTFLILCTASTFLFAEGALDDCEKQSEIAFSSALIKPSIIETLDANPNEGPEGDAWRYIAYLNDAQRSADAVGLTKELNHELSKSIIHVNFHSDFKVDAFIFKEYFWVACKNRVEGKDSIAISALSGPQAIDCFMNRNGAVDLRACITSIATISPNKTSNPL